MVELPELNEDQRLYLQKIFDYFREHLKWPTHRYLELWFFQTHPNLDIEEVAQSLPGGLTSPVDLRNDNSKAILNVSSIYQNWGTVQELDAFVRVVELCVDTYFRSPDGKPRISSNIIAENNPLWHEWAIRKVGLLLEQETLIWSSFAGPDDKGDWSCEIKSDVRRFRGVKTIEQYLEKRDQPKKSSASTMLVSDTLRLLIGRLYSKAIHPEKKEIEAGITRWEQDLTKPAEGDGGKLEVALLNALARLGIPSFFAGSASSGGPETPVFDLVALGFFTAHSPTAVLISCKSSKNQPNLGEIGKLCDEAVKIRSLLPGWLVFGTLVVLGEPTAQEFNYRQDIRIWKQSHVQAILHAPAREYVNALIWTPPHHWHPDTESIWRSQYKLSH